MGKSTNYMGGVSIDMFEYRQVTWTEKPSMYRWILIVHGKSWCLSKDPTDSLRNNKSHRPCAVVGTVPCHGSATGIPNILGHIKIHELTLGFSIHHFGDVPINIAIAIILSGGFSNQNPTCNLQILPEGSMIWNISNRTLCNLYNSTTMVLQPADIYIYYHNIYSNIVI